MAPRFPAQFTGLIRPGFAPRPIPQILRPNIPGIRPGPTPPVLSPLIRPLVPVPLVEKPQTTVYVGKIAPSVDNPFLLSLLKLCGPVKSWKRAQDPSDGSPKGFGFCEFEAAEGVLRALRLLTKLNLDGQELVLNINQATRDYLEKYVEKKTEREKFKETESLVENTETNQTAPPKPVVLEESKKESEDSGSSKEEEAQRFGIVNDEDRKADEEALEMINSMLEERIKSLPPPPPLPINAESANNKSEISDLDVGVEKKSEENGSERNEIRRERERERNVREKEREVDRYERERERDRVKRERERDDRVRQSDRVLKDRLKDWENREREREYQRHHERDREKERERERKREVKLEEESEDENDTRKRRRNNRGNNNNNNEERKRRRQREKEEDETDRFKEQEEIQEEQVRRKREFEERLLRQEQQEEEEMKMEEEEERLERENRVKDERESVVDPMQVDTDSDENNTNGKLMREEELGQENSTNINTTKKLGFGLFGSGKKSSIPSVFQQEEDEEEDDKKMRPLVPIDYSAEELEAISQSASSAHDPNNNNNSAITKKVSKKETKKVLDAKQLIDMIPTTKAELFSYEINWNIYDKNDLHERMRPWISKKITEFLGEEEETLVDYIVSCTKDHVQADKLLELLQAILDDEAEMFVLKMWRMLIFEIKRVQTGLAK